MTQYVIPVVVKSVEERKRLVRSYKKNSVDPSSEVVQEFENLGWFVAFAGSWESISLGKDQPDLKAGDMVDIVIRKRS